jgi:hypothetical protein
MDPRLEGHMIALTGGLNRWFLRHPIRGPVICFIVTVIFIGLSFIPGMGRLIYLAIPLFLVGLFLLIYALLRRAFEPPSTINYDQMDEPPEEYIEVDEQARQKAVASWRRRARQDRHRRRNPGG